MSWNEFLRRELLTREGNMTIQTHKWVEYLVRDGILPLLKEKQLDMICKPEEIASCILNHLIRHERDYKRSRFTSYRCMHGQEGTMDEYEFFEDIIPEKVWKSLKYRFYIQWFADQEAFADRVWTNLPLIIFDHLSFDSPGFSPLYEKWRHLDEEDEDSAEESFGPSVSTERE